MYFFSISPLPPTGRGDDFKAFGKGFQKERRKGRKKGKKREEKREMGSIIIRKGKEVNGRNQGKK